MKYYVYCYFDGETPIYIGKGCGDRDREHLGNYRNSKEQIVFYTRLRELSSEGRTPRIVRLLENLEEDAAIYWESFFIRALGRVGDLSNSGPLCNQTDGGERGYAHSVWEIGPLTGDFKGVSPAQSTIIGFCAFIRVCGQLIYLGTFDTPETAARMYDEAVIKYRQGRGFLNFPLEWEGSVCLRPRVTRRDRRHDFDVMLRRAETNARPEIKAKRLAAFKAYSMLPETKSRVRHTPPKGYYKGVTREGKRWKAQFACKNFGCFSTQLEAAQAYNNAVDKFWSGDGYKNRVQSIPVTIERRTKETSIPPEVTPHVNVCKHKSSQNNSKAFTSKKQWQACIDAFLQRVNQQILEQTRI